MSSADNITFGAFRLDLHNECLWANGRAITLRPKAFAVLKLLVQHSGQLVTKQQVLDAVWPGTFVGDAVLKDSIRQLREALGDDAAAPTYIETAHRRGYRFVGSRPMPTTGSAPNLARDQVEAALHAAPLAHAPAAVLGRQQDLERLRESFDRARMGKRQLIFVSGEAGIGKTTLVQAFLNDPSLAGSGVRVACGQCLEQYGSGEAYMPVLDAFSRLGRSGAGPAVVEVFRRHAPAWLAQLPSLIPPDERSALAAHAMGATRERMLREMAEAIEALTSEHPLVLVVEDLHWSDYSTLDLFSYIARRHDPARLMVIATYRPVEVILNEHPLKAVKRELQAHGLCNELTLEYLTESDIREYLAWRFPGHRLQSQLARVVHQRTEGNPLFVVDVVEDLVRDKWIVQDRDSWRLAVDLAQVEIGVPENIRQLIEKQIERLTPDERIVIEAASVAGMEFSSVALAAGLQKPTEWVEEHCEQLARRHRLLSPAWVVELPDGTITPRHRFSHVLYRDVPYAMIAPMRRAQIHHRIALRGMEVYGPRTQEIAAELAMHFEQSRDWPEAVIFLTRAAENAVRRSAHHESSQLARRGLEILATIPDSPERAQQEIKLRMVLGASLMVIKGFASDEVEDVFGAGRLLFWSQGPSPELFHMLWSLGLYYQFGSDIPASLKISEQLLDIAEGLNDGALVMEAHRSIGAALVILGRGAEAITHLDQSAALYPSHARHNYSTLLGRDCKVMSDCFAALALFALGDVEEAQGRMLRGVALARQLRHPETLIVASHCAANLHLLCGHVSLVQERAQEALELADEYGYQLWRAYSVIEMGWAEAELGDELGIAKMQDGLAAYQATGARLWTPHFLGLLAGQLSKAGRIEEGLMAVESAFKHAERSGEAYSLPELHRIKGELILKGTAQPLARNTAPRNAASAHKNSLSIGAAQSCFEAAIKIAHKQKAKAWEARAESSMERLTASV